MHLSSFLCGDGCEPCNILLVLRISYDLHFMVDSLHSLLLHSADQSSDDVLRLSRVSHCLSVVRVFRRGDIQWWGLLFALVFVTIGYLVSVLVFVTTCDWSTDWLDPLDDRCVKGNNGYTIASIVFSIGK